MPPVTALDIITDAFLEPGIFAAGETLEAQDAQFGLTKLNRLLDAWSADNLNIFAVDFLNFILVPNVQPLLIGQAAVITQAELVSNVIIYTARNSFKVGQYIDVAGCTNAIFNVTNFLVIGATPTQFQVGFTNADITPEVEDAKAVFTGQDVPNYATVAQRPARIENANIILNNVSPAVSVPLRVHQGIPGADWWAANSVRQTTTTLPTDLYYSPEWPNGKLYLWPLQTSTYGLELETWINLADIADLTYQFYLPQGYRDAITYTLAQSLCPSYGKAMDPTLAALASNARAKIKELNAQAPNMMTCDAGLPRGKHGSTYFNWLNGTIADGPR